MRRADLRMRSPVTLAWNCGLPGSGKTTFAERLVKEQNFVHLSRDNIRDQLGEYTPEKEIFVVKIVESFVKGHLLGGKSVIIDNVNHLIWQRIRYANWGKDLWDAWGVRVRKVCIFLPCTLEVALGRRQEKIKKDPALEAAMCSYAKSFQIPDTKEGYHVFEINALKSRTDWVTGSLVLPYEYRNFTAAS